MDQLGSRVQGARGALVDRSNSHQNVSNNTTIDSSITTKVLLLTSVTSLLFWLTVRLMHSRYPMREKIAGRWMTLTLEGRWEGVNLVMCIWRERRHMATFALSKLCTNHNLLRRMLSISWEGKLRFNHICVIQIFYGYMLISMTRREFILY